MNIKDSFEFPQPLEEGQKEENGNETVHMKKGNIKSNSKNVKFRGRVR